MLDFFSKITKAVDAFTDVLTENVNPTKVVPLYSYGEFAHIVRQEQSTDERICRCSILLKQVTEFEGKVYPEKKFLIKYVFLDCNNHPIPEGETANAFKGGVILASSINTKLKDFMNGKEEKTIVVKKG